MNRSPFRIPGSFPARRRRIAYRLLGLVPALVAAILFSGAAAGTLPRLDEVQGYFESYSRYAGDLPRPW